MYWEIETTDAVRPEHPEDNTVIIKANSMGEALKLLANNRGVIRSKGSPKSCKQIYYVYDDLR